MLDYDNDKTGRHIKIGSSALVLAILVAIIALVELGVSPDYISIWMMDLTKLPLPLK